MNAAGRRDVPGSILVVDDDESSREVVAEVLRAAGYRVRCATDGVAALQLMRPGAAAPDLVLLDLVMPNLNGWEVLDRMEASVRLANVPVVVLTSLVDGDHPPVRRAVLHKPLDADTLLELVGTLCAQNAAWEWALDEPPSNLLPKPPRNDRPSDAGRR